MNNILARNLLIHKQIEKVTAGLAENSVPSLLLKGSALIEAFPSYMLERVMEDIDLMIRPPDLKNTRDILRRMGYRPAPMDPWAFIKKGEPAYVDICEGLWYADEEENREIWKRSREFCVGPNMYHLPPDEFYAHVLAHAAIHHGSKELKWKRDLELISVEWKLDIEALFAGKLKRYGLDKAGNLYLGRKYSRLYSRITELDIPLKGHILRFLSLPANKKAGYILKAAFPSADFLTYRYGIKNKANLFIFRLARPFILFKNIFRFLINLTLHPTDNC